MKEFMKQSDHTQLKSTLFQAKTPWRQRESHQSALISPGHKGTTSSYLLAELDGKRKSGCWNIKRSILIKCGDIQIEFSRNVQL